jgi:ribose 5-phosphate isomerase A
MTDDLSAAERGKRAAARRALDFVEDGMRLGLGTGSTAAWMVRGLGERVRGGLDVTTVATSIATATLARDCGISVTTLDDLGHLDLTIDGADEFDPDLRLVKGAGGALLHEKIVAAASDRMIVIADPSKAVDRLGAIFPVPVEIVPFGRKATQGMVADALASQGLGGRDIVLRKGPDAPYRTDEGNLILDLHLGPIDDPAALSAALLGVPGVVETGLFLDLCDVVVIGHPDGTAELRHPTV